MIQRTNLQELAAKLTNDITAKVEEKKRTDENFLIWFCLNAMRSELLNLAPLPERIVELLIIADAVINNDFEKADAYVNQGLYIHDKSNLMALLFTANKEIFQHER